LFNEFIYHKKSKIMKMLRNGMLNHESSKRINVLQQNLSAIKMSNPSGLLRQLAVRQLAITSTELFELSQQLCSECGFFEMPHSPQKQFSVNAIKAKSCAFFGVDITAKTRKREVVWARHATALLCKKFTKACLQEIAEAIGHTDHTSAIHSINTCMNLMDQFDGFRGQVNLLIAYFSQPEKEEVTHD
jgi:chromosomal replication initiation ATPase DnaA